MPPSSPAPDWNAVDEYVRKRLITNKDVYGWAPENPRSNAESEPVAIILASASSEPHTFPETIGNILIRLKQVEEPKKYLCP